MRGERRGPRISRVPTYGSSPHARGTPATPHRSAPGPRFIPACAGNAATACRAASSVSVHPRMRGERGSVCCTALMFSGSSPHARGTHAKRAEPWALRRFIPACAGNAETAWTVPGSTSVHPRMRGERRTLSHAVAWNCGSSPHARGTPDPWRRRIAQLRFIPACAGNAMGGGTWWTRSSVHPRMRGERTTSSAPVYCPPGSSPHARGTLLAVVLNLIDRRFIPACAGNA